jgi:thioredoxin reductase (NADPH)
MDEYSCEILIIGSGPAGLAAGVYCGRAGRDTIILNGKEPSALFQTKEILNYPGYEKIEGSKLLNILKNHAENHESVRIIKGDVISLMIGMGMTMISTRTANITADAVIIATGRGVRKEVIKGESDLIGYGVSYCALCDGPLYKERAVFIYGADEEVIEDALILQQMECIVKIITNLPIDELPGNIKEIKEVGIEIIDKTEIVEVIGDSQGIIQKIITKPVDSDETNEFDLSCLFILSHIPSNSIFKKAGIELDEKGNVKVDEEQQTIIKSVFAAGDVTGGLFQVVFATAEGARAGINAAKYVRQLKKDD